MLGINLGKVGFLSKAEADDLETVLAQSSAASSRSTSGWSSRRGSGAAAASASGERHFALNDIVVARGALARVCRLDVSIDDTPPRHVHRGRARRRQPDGLDRVLVLGGGPDPRSGQPQPRRDPIAAYLSAFRSVVVSPEQVVRCRVVDAHEALVSVDGREDLPIAVGDLVEVRAVERPIRLLEPAGSLSFWDLLRRKVELLPS